MYIHSLGFFGRSKMFWYEGEVFAVDEQMQTTECQNLTGLSKLEEQWHSPKRQGQSR